MLISLDRLLIPSETAAIAAAFDVDQARRHAVALWRAARGADTSAIWRTAQQLSGRLQRIGVTDVRVAEVPADGRTVVGGWIMPVAWERERARLELGCPRTVLADTNRDPLSLALYSPPTPGGGWVSGEVTWVQAEGTHRAEALALLQQRPLAECRGRFIILDGLPITMEANRWAARRGALALVYIDGGPGGCGARYLNYAVPLDARSPCVPVFSLTPDQGARLREAWRKGKSTLRARVMTRRYAGVFPMVTGSVGHGSPPVYLCAHLDEPGAIDNASGCAVAVECLRLLLRAGVPARRAIRFYFSVEVRGQQWWFTHREPRAQFFAGLNLDMVGASPEESRRIQIMEGFRHQPHIAGPLLQAACRLATRQQPLDAELISRAAYVSDGVPGLTGGGHVALEQKPGPHYHTSGDTPRWLDSAVLRWTGIAATAFLYAATRLGNASVLRAARRIAASLRDTDPASWARLRIAGELRTLASVWGWPDRYPDYRTPQEWYRAGVSRRTGLWPSVAQYQEIQMLLEQLSSSTAKTSPDRRSWVPVSTFRGFVSFEEHVSASEICALARAIGLRPGWGTETWIWSLVSLCTGRRTLEEIVDRLNLAGMTVELHRARRLVRHLVWRGLLRLRPVLSGADIESALVRAGVRRGGLLMAHVSLSRFGYVLGGANTVIDALRSAVGPRGTLCMPTFSGSVLGWPPYDPVTSPALTGAVPEAFRKCPEVRRGFHPTHSVAAVGPCAEELVGAQRPHQAPLAREGFWGRLCDLDGQVLLLCPLRSTTIFHVGEAWLGLPQRPLVAHALDMKKRRHVYVLPNAPWHVDHFEPHFARPLLRRGLLRRIQLGDSEFYLGSARAMAEISVRGLARHPEWCLGKGGACECADCRALKTGLAQRPWRPSHTQMAAVLSWGSPLSCA